MKEILDAIVHPGSQPADFGSHTQPGPRPLPRPARPWDLSSPRECDWFGVLSEGLVVVWPAQADHEWPRAGGAWLHIAPSGAVTAFTGKVNVGQHNQTAFQLPVAEELAVDPDDVRMVQGDTDLCPYDAGTFGSRSRPDADGALRRAAAGARQILIGMAAARLGCSGAHLAADKGAVVAGLTGLRLPYGTLVAGSRRTEVLTAEPPLTPPEDRDQHASGLPDLTGYLAHVPLESRSAVAEWNDGRLTVWTATNHPFALRARLSSTFRISEAAIRVIAQPLGGFRGKHGEEAVEAARLARVAFRPVKVSR